MTEEAKRLPEVACLPKTKLQLIAAGIRYGLQRDHIPQYGLAALSIQCGTCHGRNSEPTEPFLCPVLPESDSRARRSGGVQRLLPSARTRSRKKLPRRLAVTLRHPRQSSLKVAFARVDLVPIGRLPISLRRPPRRTSYTQDTLDTAP